MIRTFVQDLGDLPLACREHFLKADALLSAVTIGVMTLVIPFVAVLDYFYYGWTEEFFATLAFEGLFVLISLLVIFGIRRAKAPQIYERLIFLWSLATSIGFCIMGFEQLDRIIENVFVVLVFTMSLYTLLENRLLFRVIPAFMMAFSYLYIFYADLAPDLIFEQALFFSATLFMINLGGVAVLAQGNHHKREDFSARQREQEARAQLEILAQVDPLTEVFNRRYFMEIFNQEMNRYERYGSRCSFALIDLDRFKDINDKHGHLAGDEALKTFARVISESKRSLDIFGRLGGEEFGLLMLETSGADSLTSLKRFLEKLRDEKMTAKGKNFSLAFSAGITEIQPADKTIDDVIRRADEALYQAKEGGRNRCVLA